MLHRRTLHRAFAIGVALCALLALGPLAAQARAPLVDSPGDLVGVDVSHWQGTIRWKDAKAAGVKFVFAKATEGQSFVDSQYARNRSRTGALVPLGTGAGVLLLLSGCQGRLSTLDPAGPAASAIATASRAPARWPSAPSRCRAKSSCR